MSAKDYSAVIDSPLGRLGIKTSDSTLLSIEYLTSRNRLHTADNQATQQIVHQLNHYFKKPEFDFELDCKLIGTDFQRSVWVALKDIPLGSTTTYGELAKKLNSSARAVGGACRKNPIPIIFPCHRVVAKTGIGGYDGDWGKGKVNIKEWLLKHEGVL